jgi:hypothetical protein
MLFAMVILRWYRLTETQLQTAGLSPSDTGGQAAPAQA